MNVKDSNVFTDEREAGGIEEREVSREMTTFEKMIDILKPHMDGCACEYESGSCELADCRECKARNAVLCLIDNGMALRGLCKWEYYNFDIYRCSHCGAYSHVKEVRGKPAWNFCPVCGARTDGGVDNG